ncbi:transposase [Candidatus Hydrogenedentota bacterium]
MDSKSKEHWVGLDWGDKTHAIQVIDAVGTRICDFQIEHSIEGMEELIDRLRRIGPVAGVAIETSRHLVVHALLRAAFVVYPINPIVCLRAFDVAG